jgi:hypothetical protein
MRPARGFVRLVSRLAIGPVVIVMAVALLGGQRAAQASTPASQASQSREGGPGAPAGPDEGGAKKKARKPGAKSNGKKTSPKSKASPATKVTRGKSSTHLAPQKLAHAQSGKSGTKAGTKSDTINEDVTLTPFPSHAGAAKKALAQNRRDQLDDAEKAARAPEQAERWQTVLFHLRDLDARSDSEGCFWRLVSYYRLGQIERARSLRPACELAAKDAAIIEAEDEQAAGLQSAGTLADKDPAPVGNLAPYAGAGPARVDR